jgi:Mannosyltransferase OCH1 and related enzymes
MIPQTIHYCWFGNNPLSQETLDYIKTWKKHLPEYQIIQWDESNFDTDSVIWVKEAIENKKYAFATDYIRLDILYRYGGIYFDTDVEVLQSLDDLLELPYFIGAENTIHGINTALIATQPKSPWIKCCLEHYRDRHFLRNGKMDMRVNPELIKDTLLKNGYALNPISTKREFSFEEKHFNIFPATWFSPKNEDKIELSKDTYVIHHYLNSWRNEKKTFMNTFKEKVKKNIPHSLMNIILKYKKRKRDLFFDQ